MLTFEEFGLTWVDGIIISLIGIGVFIITYLLYPPLIRRLIKAGWVGYDIHKVDRPKTAESGGIGCFIGIVLGLIVIGIVYWDKIGLDVLAFLLTILASAGIGLWDDQKRLSSMKKIVLMVLAGVPILIFSYFHTLFPSIPFSSFTLTNPAMPVVGRLRLTLLYPLITPIIITITTNTVNMLEGYNGEGSGTSSISLIFIIIAAVIAQSSEGLIFGIPVLAAVLAFFMFNRYPSKAFPGDIGTLVIGAAIGMIAILGSLEVVMFCAILTQVFNSFYVIASVKGFRESHEIKVKDIWLNGDNKIHASDEKKAPMTLPRLILAKGELSEPELVKNFLALAVISGFFAIVADLVIQWSLSDGVHNIALTIIAVVLCIIGFIYTLIRFRKIIGITIIMILLLGIGFLVVYIFGPPIIANFKIDSMDTILGVLFGGIILLFWYIISVRYFWWMIEKMKKIPGYVSTKQHQEEIEAQNEAHRIEDEGLKRQKPQEE